MTRAIPQSAIDLVKSFETFQSHAYLPTPNDVPTIGYGHTGTDVNMGAVCTEDQAEAWLAEDMAGAAAEVDHDATAHLTDDEFGALVSLTFNIGRGAFRNSTLLRKLNAGDYQGAAQQFLVWNKQAGKELTGLDRRRAAEEALFEETDNA